MFDQATPDVDDPDEACVHLPDLAFEKHGRGRAGWIGWDVLHRPTYVRLWE